MKLKWILPALSILLSACTSTLTVPAITMEKIPDDVRAQQIKDMKFGMFICWSFSTFSGQEWTPTLDKDASYFKATNCDTDQWCQTAKAAGMNYILFLSKHHDGFCLWDTATTEKKVTNSPLGIDVLAKLRKSCDKYGIKLALYFSEGDWNWPGAVDGKGGAHGGGVNPNVKKAQLKELLSNYGPIEFWWMDHAVGEGGLSHEETVEWMHKFQPNTFVGFNHGAPAGRICLRERGKPGKLGDAGSTKYNKKAERAYKRYLVAEFTYPILPEHKGGAQWFYSLPKHNNLCHPPEKLYKDHLGAEKYGNIFSIDVGPNYEGRLRDIDVKTLKKVGEMIRSENTTQQNTPTDVINGFEWKSDVPKNCPFEQSETLTGIFFTGRHSDYRCGDTFYPSWASDGNMYSPWTDGTTDGIKSVSGAGKNATTGHAVMIGDDPLTLIIKNTSPPKKASAKPYQGRYPCGSLVHNGIWYYGTYCLGPDGRTKHEGFTWNWPNLGPMPGFQISRNLGKTWTASPLSPENPLFPEPDKYLGPVKMGAPHFVDFGQNMKHSPDGKAYLLGMGAEENDPKRRPCIKPGPPGKAFQINPGCDDDFAHANLSWITADQVYLARVTPSPETINRLDAYEFFAGHNQEGKPLWTGHFDKIKPLIEWNNHMGCVTATYVPGLKKYLMCITDGWPTVAKMTSYILEADQLTGPWRMVVYMKDFGEQAYFLNFPSKFISEDGKTLWLCYSANFSSGWNGVKLNFNPPGGRYGLSLHEVRLQRSGVANVSEQKTHLFILSGQSNMVGLDPKISFTPTVETAFGKDNVIVVKDAQGGQPIRRWYKKWKLRENDKPGKIGDLYDRLMTNVNAAIKGRDIQTVTFVWMQGERDAREGHGKVYADSFKGLLDQLGTDLGRKDINFVIGRLSDFDMDNKKYPHWTMVRKAQVAVAQSDPRGAWVNTDDLNDGKNRKGKQIKNDLHYSVEGYKTLGKRFAEKAIALINKKEKHKVTISPAKKKMSRQFNERL